MLKVSSVFLLQSAASKDVLGFDVSHSERTAKHDDVKRTETRRQLQGQQQCDGKLSDRESRKGAIAQNASPQTEVLERL